MSDWYVYILRCGDGTLYTGITDNVPRRLSMHETGRGAKYTRGRGRLSCVTRNCAAINPQRCVWKRKLKAYPGEKSWNFVVIGWEILKF